LEITISKHNFERLTGIKTGSFNSSDCDSNSEGSKLVHEMKSDDLTQQFHFELKATRTKAFIFQKLLPRAGFRQDGHPRHKMRGLRAVYKLSGDRWDY